MFQKGFPQAVKDLGFMRADTADKNRRHWRKNRWIAKGYYKIPRTCGKTVICILDVSEEDGLKGKVKQLRSASARYDEIDGTGILVNTM